MHDVLAQLPTTEHTQVLSLLRDPVWGAVGALIAVVAIVVTIVVAVKSSKKRRFACITADNSQLPGVSKVRGLTLKINDQELEAATVWALTFQNTGKEPISPADFNTPLGLTFRGGEAIWAVGGPHEKTPKDLQLSFEFTDIGLNVKPGLLNPGDSFWVLVFTAGTSTGFDLSGRIVGVKRIQNFGLGYSKIYDVVSAFRPEISLITTFGLLITWISGAPGIPNWQYQIFGLIFSMIFLLNFFVMVIDFTSLKSRRKFGL